MTRQRHYHPLAALRFLRKAVVVCLLPLANALLEFSLNALLTALRQDAALLLFLCGASSILLEASSWALDEAGVLRLRWAFISKQERIIRGEALAALTIERPLFFRLLGASRVVLYPVGQPAKRAVTLYLHKEDAQELADRLMPVRDPVCHRPAGGERAALVVLGANGLKNAAFYLGMNDKESAKKDLNLLLESKNEYEKTNQNLLELYQNSSNDPKNKTAWMDKAKIDYYTEYMQKHMEHLAIVQELFTILNDENMYTKWHEKQINQAKELIMKSNFYLTS